MGPAIGAPRETARGEVRALLTPATVKYLREQGFVTHAEHGYGEAVGHSDGEYEAAGAVLCDRRCAWDCPVILKYKAPIPEEFQRFVAGRIVAAIFHAEGDRALTEALVRTGVTAYSFEFFEDDQGDFPLMAAGGAIAGHQAVLFASYHLQRQHGGRGILLSHTGDFASRAQVLVIGSGHVGSAAADIASRMGAEVTVLCSNE